MRVRVSLLVVVAVVALLGAACGGGSDDADGGEPSQDATTQPPADTAPSGGGDDKGGRLVVGDETIILDGTRCFLQDQDVAGGPGKIVLSAQGFGTNAAGEEVLVDFVRYDEDSDFTGDDILLDIGSLSLRGGGYIGTVTRNGDNLKADNLTWTNFDDFAADGLAGSMELNC